MEQLYHVWCAVCHASTSPYPAGIGLRVMYIFQAPYENVLFLFSAYCAISERCVTTMRSTNLHFTYLLTFLLSYLLSRWVDWWRCRSGFSRVNTTNLHCPVTQSPWPWHRSGHCWPMYRLDTAHVFDAVHRFCHSRNLVALDLAATAHGLLQGVPRTFHWRKTEGREPEWGSWEGAATSSPRGKWSGGAVSSPKLTLNSQDNEEEKCANTILCLLTFTINNNFVHTYL